MASTEIAVRFPAHQGFRRQSDIPTFTDMTARALQASLDRQIRDADLGRMLVALAPRSDGQWAAMTIRARMLLIADRYGALRELCQIEACDRIGIDLSGARHGRKPSGY